MAASSSPAGSLPGEAEEGEGEGPAFQGQMPQRPPPPLPAYLPPCAYRRALRPPGFVAPGTFGGTAVRNTVSHRLRGRRRARWTQGRQAGPSAQDQPSTPHCLSPALTAPGLHRLPLCGQPSTGHVLVLIPGSRAAASAPIHPCRTPRALCWDAGVEPPIDQCSGQGCRGVRQPTPQCLSWSHAAPQTVRLQEQTAFSRETHHHASPAVSALSGAVWPGIQVSNRKGKLRSQLWPDVGEGSSCWHRQQSAAWSML